MQNFIKKFCEENKIPLKLTMGATALAHYRKNYLKEKIWVEEKEIRDICRFAYYGGRTEVFRRGTFENVNCYDFNSLYPSVMLGEFPKPGTGVYTQAYSLKLVQNYEGACYVEGIQKDCFIPLLPLKTKDKLLFPVGKIKGYYTNIELREALQNGFTITKFGEGVYYRRCHKPFEKFVKDMYKIRLQQKKQQNPMEKITKLIMNSLYGKWGFNYWENSEVMQRCDLTHKHIDEMIQMVDLDETYISVTTESDEPTSYSFLIWASYITAKGRIKLFREMKKHQKDLLYCDTDSLFLKDGIRITSGKNLGELDHEYNTQYATFVKPKFYATDNNIKIKGIKTKLTKEKFISLINGKSIIEDRFIKFRSTLRSQPHHTLGKLEINQVIKIHKKMSAEDTKRKWSNTFDYTKQETSKPLSDVAENF